jgi:hypothetical protein
MQYHGWVRASSAWSFWRHGGQWVFGSIGMLYEIDWYRMMIRMFTAEWVVEHRSCPLILFASQFLQKSLKIALRALPSKDNICQSDGLVLQGRMVNYDVVKPLILKDYCSHWAKDPLLSWCKFTRHMYCLLKWNRHVWCGKPIFLSKPSIFSTLNGSLCGRLFGHTTGSCTTISRTDLVWSGSVYPPVN